MPALNQDFIIYDLDEFQVRFNISDAVNDLDGSNARAWWGVAADVTDTTPLIERSTNFSGWTNPGSGPPTNFNDVDFGGNSEMTISPTYIDILVRLDESPVTNAGPGGSIDLQPSNASYPAFYYHECIYASDGNQQDSVGVATGQITVNQSLFTEQGHRA